MGLRIHVMAVLAAVVAWDLSASAARAAVITFDTAGYSVGALAGQPGTGPTWSDSNNAFVIAAGVGDAGSNALETGSNAASAFTASYAPAVGDYSSTFAAEPAIAYSFQVKSTGASQTVRVYLGSNTATTSGQAANFQLGSASNGSTFSIKLADGSTTVYPSVSASTFHTISGVIDYTAKTFTVSVDGNAANAASYPFTGALSNYGSIFVQERTTASSSAFIFDNFNVDSTTVPEPAALGMLAAAAGLLARRRRVSDRV